MKKVYVRFQLILLLSSFCLYLQAANNQSSADSATTISLQPIDIIDINYQIEKVEKTFKKIDGDLNANTRFFEIDSSFKAYKIFLEDEANELKAYNPYNLSKYFLESTYRLWEGFYKRLNGWRTEVNNRLKLIQNNIKDLEKTKKIWGLTLESADVEGVPTEAKEKIREVINKSQNYISEIQKQKRKYIILEDQIAEMTSFCNYITTWVGELQQNKRDSLFVAVDEAIWNIKVNQSDYLPIDVKLNKSKHENVKTLNNYFQTERINSGWLPAFFIILGFLLLRYYYLKKDFDDSLPGHKTIIRIFRGHPVLTTITLLLVLFHLTNPYYPLLLNNILTLILLINMSYILSPFINESTKRFIFRIIILLVVNNLEIIFWYFGDVARYYLFFETGLGLILTYPRIRLKDWKAFKLKDKTIKAQLLLTIFAFSFYAVAFIANIFGYVNVTVLFAKVGIHVPEFTVVLYGVYLITVAIIKAIVKLGITAKGESFNEYWLFIEKWAIKVAGIFGIYYWFFSFTVSFEISRITYDAIAEFITEERTIGTMQITLGSIFALILILIGTFILTGFLKVLIEKILFKKSKLPRGIPAAISVTIRYFLIILGFMFALSAAGIELGKFSLLAGALGVGIGFGLQNIVNNFISGLILVYERPLQVGDTIEVENLLGQVNRIGIRSSNVKTYDGAEVIVPNGNLISNQLINWTLSDNQRRIDFRIGVSYGSDPNQVLKILEQVALDNEDTLKFPAPRALFDEFGDSSLNFRLLFWVPYDIGIGTKSDVAIEIFNKFKENNIEIPFPQLDLHLKEKLQNKKEDED
jgi:small-conductance mechanosensitive channel